MTQSSIAELDRALNDAILNGTALEAFETYYADDVVMQENDAAGLSVAATVQRVVKRMKG